MTLRKSILLVVALGMVSALVGCSSSSSSNNNNTIAISANSGYTASAAVGGSFGSLSVTVTQGGSALSGASVTFTAPSSGASGNFADNGTPGVTDTETTNSSGVATSTVFTANSTAGAYTVSATTTGATSSASFGLTNTSAAVTGLAPGNYVYYVSGQDSGSADNLFTGPYFLAGTFTVDSSGTNITGGEQDFSDYDYFVSAEAVTGGSIAASSDGNLLITINTGDINIGPGAQNGSGTGTLVLDASMASSTRGLITEYDDWATASGELNFQTAQTSACATTPCGFAFTVGGLDAGGYGVASGGVVVVDGVNSISGTGSVFDVNDYCGSGTCTPTVLSAQTFTASTVTTPDSYGFVTFTLNSSDFGSSGLILDGYMIDASHIRLVENWYDDVFDATTGGTAIAQATVGGYTTASVEGSTYVASLAGLDADGIDQAAAQVTFNNDGSTLSGNISYNDLVVAAPQGGNALTGGTYLVDAAGTGRVTLSGVTDGTAYANLELYLTGGKAVVMSMDSALSNWDVLGGAVWPLASNTYTLASITGNYAMDLGQINGSEQEGDAVGVLTSDGAGDLTGFLDQNGTIGGGTLQADQSLSATLATTSTNGVYTVTPTNGDLTAYIIDPTQGVVIENDTGSLTLGYFANQ